MPLKLLEPVAGEPGIEFQSQIEAQLESHDEVLFPQIPWAHNTTAVFLQDSIGLPEKQPFDTTTSTETADNGESE